MISVFFNTFAAGHMSVLTILLTNLLLFSHISDYALVYFSNLDDIATSYLK